MPRGRKGFAKLTDHLIEGWMQQLIFGNCQKQKEHKYKTDLRQF